MSSEDTLIQIRLDKHKEINNCEYPVTHSYSDSIALVLKAISNNNPTITLDPTLLMHNNIVHGRVIALRKSGGISFIKISDYTGSIQLIASKSVLSDYDNLRLLDLGDIVEVTGKQCLSKTNEPSILIQEWKILTKSHRPPPDKFSGLTDQEVKYRQRYLDLMSSEESRARFVVRTNIIRAIRSFMDARDFLEVETSTLNTIASGANASPFTTHHNALDCDLKLRIAPELYLKRLLVGGLDRVYEIGKNYRNEGIDTRHNPEFTMMECYLAYGDFSKLLSFTKNLFSHIDSYLNSNLSDTYLKWYSKWHSERTFSLEDFVIIPMWDAVLLAAKKADILLYPKIHPLINSIYSVNTDFIESLDSSNERIKKINIAELNSALQKCNSNGQIIYCLFEYIVEPFLVEDYRTSDGSKSLPVIITQYPKEVSPLARAIDNYPTLCERFELFVEGRELANAFQELNDPSEQNLRFKEQLVSNEKDPMNLDSDYIEALEYGMPPAVGFGLGIDRLCMLLTNTSSIKDVILFPTLKPKN